MSKSYLLFGIRQLFISRGLYRNSHAFRVSSIQFSLQLILWREKDVNILNCSVLKKGPFL